MQRNNIKSGESLASFLRWGIYLTALVPLVIFKDFISPFHFGKVIIFRSLIEILGVAYFLLILKDRSYLPRIDRIFWAIFSFVLAFSITTITSVLRHPSFWGSLERMGGLWTFWHYFLFFIILISVLRKREHWQRLFDLTIFVGVLSAFYGFGQKTDISFFVGSGGRERIFGTIGNSALFAGYQLFTVFLSLIMALVKREWRTWYSFSFIITSVAVLITAVRGSVLGYGVGLLVFAFLWFKHGNPKAGKKALNLLVVLVAFFFLFSLLFGDSSFVKGSRYLRRITDLSFSSPTVQTRFWAWHAGLKGWVQDSKTIVFGWGPENFNIPFSKNFNPKFYVGMGSETLFDRAHNMFVEVLVTMGIIGLLTYINIFLALFTRLKEYLRSNEFFVYGAGLTSVLVAYLIHNSFIFDTSANFIVFFVVAGFISNLKNFDSQSESAPRAIFGNGAAVSTLGVILTVAVAILIYKTNILPARANYATTRAIVAGWQGDFDKAIAKYKEALSYDLPGKYEYRHRLAQYLIGEGGPSIKESKVRDAYTYTLSEIDKNIKENRVDYLPHLYASRLNIVLGKDDPASEYNDKALEHSLMALEISPTFIRTYFEIAQSYLNKKDYPKAVEYFQRAVDLNPGAGISNWYLGAAKIEAGDLSGIKDMEQAILNEYSPDEQENLRMLSIYIKEKNFTRIAQVYERLISTNPKDPQYYASLAAAYANLGRFDDAEAMARKAVDVDPSFENDARAFLKMIGREF